MCGILSELCDAGALAASHGKQLTEPAQEAPTQGQANVRQASVQQPPAMCARSELNAAEAERQRALQRKVALSP